MTKLNEEKGISYEVEEAVDFVFNLITNDLKTNKTKSYNSLYLTVKNSFEINLFGESFVLVYNFTVTDDIKIYDILKIDILPRLKCVGFFDYQHNCN